MSNDYKRSAAQKAAKMLRQHAADVKAGIPLENRDSLSVSLREAASMLDVYEAYLVQEDFYRRQAQRRYPSPPQPHTPNPMSPRPRFAPRPRNPFYE